MTEQRGDERQSVRIVFYLTPTWAARLDEAVEAAGQDHRGPFVRHLVEQTLEGTDVDRAEMPDDIVALQLELTEARAENRGLQALVDQMRERLGPSRRT